MADNWLPGATRSPQSGGVQLDKSLPERATWHITWDALNNGQRPAFSAVSNYLKNQGYCPHIMWDPFTGYIEQYYPANVGGRALAAWNQDGAVNIQIEVFFSPGTVYGGKKYMSVAETPCVGLDKLMAWLRSHGIADRWPMGEPKWAPWPTPNSGNSRNRNTWDGNGGHYGHCHVPDNTHTDPGPMPDLFKSKGTAVTPASAEPAALIEEDEMPSNIWNGTSKDQPLTAGKWKTLEVNSKGYITVLNGNQAQRSINFATLTAKGLPKGAELHARFVVVDYQKGKITKVYKHMPYSEIIGTGGATVGQHITPINLPKNSRYRIRLQVVTYATGVTIDNVHIDSYCWKA